MNAKELEKKERQERVEREHLEDLNEMLDNQRWINGEDVGNILDNLYKVKDTKNQSKQLEIILNVAGILEGVKWCTDNTTWILDQSDDTVLNDELQYVRFSILGYTEHSKNIENYTYNEILPVNDMIKHFEFMGKHLQDSEKTKENVKLTPDQKKLYKMREQLLDIFNHEYVRLMGSQYKFEPCDPKNNEDNAMKDPAANEIFKAWLTGKGNWGLYQLYIADDFAPDEVEDFQNEFNNLIEKSEYKPTKKTKKIK